MKIIKRKRNNRYTTICNEPLRDNTLSYKAKGLLCMIMGLPDEWVFSIEGLAKISKEGLTSIYSTVNELIEKGYCKRVAEREKGKFVHFTYMFSDNKSLLDDDEPFIEKPFMENPKVEKPYMENQRQLNTYINNNLIKSSTTNCGTLENEVEEMKMNTSWIEPICMSHHIKASQLDELFNLFILECKCNAIEGHNSMADAQQHFNSWLRIYLRQHNNSSYATNRKPNPIDNINQAQQSILNEIGEFFGKTANGNKPI